MNVGLVSIFDNTNFGNRLQNYALQQVLLGYCKEVKTLKNKSYTGNTSRLLRKYPVAESIMLNRLAGRNKRAELLRFTKRHIFLSKACYWHDQDDNVPASEDRCDFFCAGSDQVWNPHMGRSKMFNYLGFADRERTFSYAASFGVNEIPEQFKEEVRTGLQHIKYISVREDAGKRIVEELTGRTDAEVLVDPTMLLTAQEWDKILRKPKAELPEKYILTYFLGLISPERRDVIQRKARQMDCALIEVMDENSPFYAIGPDEFVYLIKHAALVCTDSFHGSVFSFMYQRKMAIFDREGKGNNMAGRIDTFTTKFHLENCRVRGNHLPENVPEPDYSEGYQTLELERKKSETFLNKVFEKE